MLRKIRIVLAAVMLIGITWLFVDFTGTARHLFSWMAKLQALEAILALNVAVMVGLAVLTLVFGRIYCSVICPLGIMQDVFGWLGKKVKKNRYTYSLLCLRTHRHEPAATRLAGRKQRVGIHRRILRQLCLLSHEHLAACLACACHQYCDVSDIGSTRLAQRSHVL